MAASLVWMAVLLLVATTATPLNRSDPVVIGKTFLASSTNPTSGSTAWALTSHGIAEKLFTVDQGGNIVGQVAESVKKINTLTWEVSLKPGYSFSDGTMLTAQHAVDALTELNNVNNAAKASVGTMSVTALGSRTLRIVTERATPVMDAVLAEWVFVIYIKKLGSYIFTGPYAVSNFVAGDRFELIPNGHYPRASERPLHLTIKKFPDGQSVVTALKAGDLDMGFHLPVDLLHGIRQQAGLSVKSFEVGYHYMMWHNIRKSPLSDLRVRKAVDLAIDRTALSQELRGGKGTRSLFPDYTPYFLDGTDPHANTVEATKLLDEAGWTLSGNTRMKGGVQLTLDLVAYPQRPGLVSMHPVIEQAMVALGITINGVITSGASWTQLDQIIADKDFDLLMWAQNTLPAGDPQWFLNNFFRSDSTSNHAGLNLSSVDNLLNDLAHKDVHSQRVSAAAAAHTAILNQVPVSNLVTPAWHVGLNSRLSTYTPWGSDYYVIRADTFIMSEAGGGGGGGGGAGPGNNPNQRETNHAILAGFSTVTLSLIFSLL